MRTIKLLALALSLLVISCKNDDDMPPPTPTILAGAIENIIQPMVDDDTTVGAAVGIIKPGGEKEMFFFGEKTKNQNDAFDENTLFEIGSITKTMTASILADQVLKDEIILDAPVENYLKGIENFPSYNDQKITFKHLANHTSSLPRLPENFFDGNFDENHPYLNYTQEMLYEFLDGYDLPRPIGSVEDYSNLATGLLGHLLAENRNTSFETQLHEVIFQNLGMTNSHTANPNIHNFAQPYDEDFNPWPMWEMSDVTLGAGGVKSTMKDMLVYLEANLGYGNSPINEALAFTHPNTQSLNDPFGVGLCWNNAYKEEDNTTLTWHDGVTRGTSTFIGFIKELDLGVFVVFNTEVIERSGDPLKAISTGIDILNKIKEY